MAQEDYRFDIGGGVGMTGYLGDANTANLLKHPGWDVQALLRYMVNPRFAFKTNLYVGSVSGNSADMTNVFPDNMTFKFNTTFYEVGELFEFNFFNYGMDHRRQSQLHNGHTHGPGRKIQALPTSEPRLRVPDEEDLLRQSGRRNRRRPLRHKTCVHEEYRLDFDHDVYYKLRIFRALQGLQLQGVASLSA